MTATTLSASTTTTPASRPSPKPNDVTTKSRGRPATKAAALGDWGIPGGPEVFSTRCPPLPRLRMRESRELVHRAVLRAKGLDPDLVPSPSKSPDQRGVPRYEKNAPASASPRAPPNPSTPRTDLGASSAHSKQKHLPMSSSADRLNERVDDDALDASTKASNKHARDLFLEDVELETLLPKSRGGVGGGGGGDFTKGVGATHFLKVKHEVQNARLERRVRLALVDPNKAPEVDAVDVASEIPGVKIAQRLRRRRGGESLETERKKTKERPKAPSPYMAGTPSVKKPNAKDTNVSANAKTIKTPRLAPSMAYAARVAAQNAAGTLAFNKKRKAIVRLEQKRGVLRETVNSPSDDHLSSSCMMSPRATRVSASLRALVAEAPTHVAAAVDDVAAAAARVEKRETRSMAAKVRLLADARNAARDRNAKLAVELEHLNEELFGVKRTNAGSEEGEKASGTTANFLRAEIDATKTFAEDELERAKTREHVASRLRETVLCLRRGVDATKETIAECDADVLSCRAYADDALRFEQRAVAALEWIKKKYLLKANSWKKDLEAQKEIREALAEEARELRAAERRRGAQHARARQASEAFMEVQKEKEEGEKTRREFENRSEDAAKTNVIRLAVAVGLGKPETRTPDAVVQAVRANELRKVDALEKVEELQATEAERWRVLLEKRETLRKTRLGLGHEESSEAFGRRRSSSSSSSSTTTRRTPLDDDQGNVFGDELKIVSKTKSPSPVTAHGRDVEHRLGQATRVLARKFKRFKETAARLVAVDEGLKKIDDAVKRTRARVGDFAPRRGHASTLGRPPIAAPGERRSSEAAARRSAAVDGKATPESRRADESRDSRMKETLGRAATSKAPRPSVGGRAAETQSGDSQSGDSLASPRPRRVSAHVDSVAETERSSLAAASTTSSSRWSSTPASPSASVRARLTSAASAASAASARPPRVSRVDPFGVFDRISRPRASAAAVSHHHTARSPEKNTENAGTERTEPGGVVHETRAKTPTRTRDEMDSEEDALFTRDAASAATRLLASSLPARFENTARSILEVLGSIPRGADGSHARASVVLGGARDKVSGGLRGGLAGYVAASRGSLVTTKGSFFSGRGSSRTVVSQRGAGDDARGDASDPNIDALLRSLLCARPGKVPVAAGEVDDDPARMRLKRGRAYREMAMKWCFRAGRPIADEEDSGDELHAVAGEDGVLRFNEASNGQGGASGEEFKDAGATGATSNGASDGSNSALDPHASHGALDLARAANVGLSAAAFRRLVARTRKAGVVPTRADLKKASRRAEEKRARLLERAKRLAEAEE